ncbi:PIG-L deacetylase family protein [Prolixibacter denitrificans]|uniref:GlcNAc-PI de-N-acetylase n=1 Tax=Prolixibacter denitrificans TaxID=1541063 RepID=A0A2P8CE54_9BACT|nr:PIG-L family deacetylase [Prolixibacter denitrificans]PSK83264.1 LmbE family N-acetylglucosaminyl deacetylase [Prolixibacter denitrificans]GET21853.1 GlcNAc-PI de-N-acetylase [Prolixibacter denitrificans]
MTKNSRRQFLTQTVPLTIGATMGITQANAMGNSPSTSSGKKLKLVVVGAHPDDPETMCGGVMALYANTGHEVVSAYLTRGEAGIEGKSHEEAAKIRTAEALTACRILKCRPEFLGQIDGNTEITREKYGPISDFLEKENPDIIITHWPIDTHRDHRICSNLVYDAWLRMKTKPTLYFGEVMTGAQSQNFAPTDYVDITGVIKQKHEACYAHVSQKVDEWYPNDHARMEVFRGMEFGCDYAEAFVQHVRSPGDNLNEVG